MSMRYVHIDDFDFAINFLIIVDTIPFMLSVSFELVGIADGTTLIQCAVTFSPRKKQEKETSANWMFIQSVHLYSLSRSGESKLHLADIRLAASRKQQFFKVKIVFIVLTFIHISFLC